MATRCKNNSFELGKYTRSNNEILGTFTCILFMCSFCAPSKHRQSQMGKLGREALSPQELASFQDSISSFAASQKNVAVDISSDANALLQLLSQTADDAIAESSQGIEWTLLLWLLFGKWVFFDKLLYFKFITFFLYLVVIDEDEPVVNQSIVQEVVEASQRSFSQDLCKFTQLQIILPAQTSRARACLWFWNMKLPGSAMSLQVVPTLLQSHY